MLNNGDRISLVQADITKLDVDAIVNAANNSLLGGGGVDGAIHKAAGPELLAECRTLNGCATGEAKLTKGYKLPAKYVIHTVGPFFKTGLFNEAILLKNCYSNSLKIAEELKLESIAFPSISTGAYHFPIRMASRIAIRAVNEFLAEHEFPRRVVLVCFDIMDFTIYQNRLNEMTAEGDTE